MIGSGALQLFPGKEETYSVPFTRVVYIEADDFREEDPGKKYYGLAPGKSVLLRYCLQPLHIVQTFGIKQTGCMICDGLQAPGKHVHLTMQSGCAVLGLAASETCWHLVS